MNAREIVLALGGRWCGHYGMVKCPTHDDHTPSLELSDGENGDVLVFCFAGCSWGGVRDALRRDGLLPDRGSGVAQRPDLEAQALREAEQEAEKQKRIQAARQIWREAVSAIDTHVETYLCVRGITISPPPTIRFHPDLPHGPSKLGFPTMVAAVQGPDRKITGIHRTFLLPSGEGKARVSSPRMMLGCISGGAVRLAKAGPKLAIAEGIESALSVAQACPETPVWAALSVANMGKVVLPPIVRELVLCLDGDAPGTPAADAAHNAGQMFLREGRKVRIARPPRGMDFNDLLRLPENVVSFEAHRETHHD